MAPKRNCVCRTDLLAYCFAACRSEAFAELFCRVLETVCLCQVSSMDVTQKDPLQTAASTHQPASLKLTWVHGLRGMATLIILLGHFRLCFWEWATYGSTDGQVYLMQRPIISLIWAGKPAVRLLMILSGIVLSNRTLSCIEAGSPTKGLKAVLRAVQMRYLRLAIPLTFISIVSVTLLWLGAFDLGRNLGIKGYFQDGPPKSHGNVFLDFWRAIWGGLVDMYILGYQPAHSSLWCMKAQLLGSYLLFGTLLVSGGRQKYPYLMWILGAVILFNGHAAAARLTDAAGVLFGGIVAYHMRFHKADASTSGVLNAVLVLGGLLICSYPTWEPNTWWGNIMLRLGRIAMQITTWDAKFEHSHQKAVAGLWHTIGASMIVFAVSRIEHRDKIFSNGVLQWAGTNSFGLFVIHPLVFWSLGAWSFHFTRQFMFSFDLVSVADAAAKVAFLLISLPVTVVLCRFWHIWIDTKLFQYLQKAIPEPGDSWLPAPPKATPKPAPKVADVV